VQRLHGLFRSHQLDQRERHLFAPVGVFYYQNAVHGQDVYWQPAPTIRPVHVILQVAVVAPQQQGPREIDAVAGCARDVELRSTMRVAASVVAVYHHEPPDFRTTWCHLIRSRNLSAFSNLQASIIRAIVKANTTCDSIDCSAPFWWLYFT
jgi:hypothetical protein